MNLLKLQRWAASAPRGTLVPAESLAAMLAGDGDGDGDRLSDLSLVEAAEKLGKAPSTIRSWLLAGELAGYKLHREWRITRASIRAFLEDQKNGGGTRMPPSRGKPADLSEWREARP